MISVSMFSYRVAMVAALALAVTGLSRPALADSATAVTFAANNPWAQEIGTIDHYNASHDYTVAVAAGKTLHVKLFTRNPNIFLKIDNQTADQQLVDTMQTGATTWSGDVTSASTFSIKVYVDPAAMERGDSAKYALQIGAFGAADLQPASTAVTFQPNNPWAQELGRIDSGATAHDYTVAVAAGNTLQVNLIAKDSNLHFKVLGADQSVMVDTGTATIAPSATGAITWSTAVTAPATYTVRVYADPASVPQGAAFGYALQLGQYATNRTAPASAGSTAAPATTSTVAAPASSGNPAQ